MATISYKHAARSAFTTTDSKSLKQGWNDITKYLPGEECSPEDRFWDPAEGDNLSSELFTVTDQQMSH